MKELAVVIPVYNEEEVIEKIVNDWTKILPSKNCDLIIVNDGSKDKTEIILSKCKDNYKNLIIINKTNEGHGAAICDGYKYALEKKYSYVFQTDSDDQFFSSDFKILWENKENSNYDMILGNRHKRDDHFLRVFLSKVILRLILKTFFRKQVTDANIPYRLIDTKFLMDFMKLKPEKFIAPNIIMTLHAKNVKFIKIRHTKRNHGELQWSIKKLLKFGLILIKDLRNYYTVLKKYE